MSALVIVMFEEPIHILLKLREAFADPLVELNPYELISHRAMKALAEAFRLWRMNLGVTAVDRWIEVEVEVYTMLLQD